MIEELYNIKNHCDQTSGMWDRVRTRFCEIGNELSHKSHQADYCTPIICIYTSYNLFVEIQAHRRHIA